MSTYERESQDADGIADETKRIDVAGGALIYRVEREHSDVTGTDRIIAQELVDIEIEDPERLRPVLAELGHETSHVTHGGVER
jgi:hypothetical protein